MNPDSPALSVLDLVPVSTGRGNGEALAEMCELARTAEDAGYSRYWIGEHHSSSAYLASATTVLMGQVLAATSRIVVLSGGIMLPNHAPLVVAEQVGTLATMYPGRVEIGLGRAPGADPATARALRRGAADPRTFAEEILQTLGYLGDAAEVDGRPAPALTALPGEASAGSVSRRVRAMPGEGTRPRAWILGSSVNGARVAGTLGLPFVFSSHLVPAAAEAAITSYRSVFDATAATSYDGVPHVAASFNVLVAPTQEEAEYLFTSTTSSVARILGGEPGPLDPPTRDREAWHSLAGGQDSAVEASLEMSFVGAADQVAARLHEVADRWGLDEVLVVTYAHDPAARRRSYRLLSQAW